MAPAAYRAHCAALLIFVLLTSSAVSAADITLIHMGDVHGHLVPRPAGERGDARGKTEGGLARMATRISEIRARSAKDNTLLVNTGDTIQGSAEALYTKGQALVDVLNPFGIGAYVPGNWEFVYGVPRFVELFAGEQPKAPWNAIAANAYYDGEPFTEKTGQRLLPPTLVKDVGGVKVGLIGLTTDRGPQVVGTGVTKGVRFTKGDDEIAHFTRELRDNARVDLVVVLSELGLANNIRLADKTPGVDIILSSDMHEVTRVPVRTKTGTLIVEAGQDGQVLGEFRLTVEGGKLKKADWTLHRIDETIPEEPRTAKLVSQVRAPFVKGPAFVEHTNPFNGTRLKRPIDTVVGRTSVPLHRTNFTGQSAPAVIEGTSHNLLTDAFRAEAKAEIGAIRGFRYGTMVPPGPVKLEDLYHFVPIGPLIAKGTIQGKQLKAQIEGAADGSLNPDVSKWTGGWLFGFSGVRIQLDPAATTGERAKLIEVYDTSGKAWRPLDPERDYSYASYHYTRDPGLINVLPATGIEVLKDETGQPLDGTEVVARYLHAQPQRTVAPSTGRVTLLRPLPAKSTESPEVQPWRGATAEPAQPLAVHRSAKPGVSAGAAAAPAVQRPAAPVRSLSPN
jgi:S-sulfosulfanyl-L-cysteine sulfohydrolase